MKTPITEAIAELIIAELNYYNLILRKVRASQSMVPF
jgi:hypothetical protein